jgi:hypothetical protein
MAKLSEEEKARRAANRRRKAALAAEENAIRHENKQREWAANGTRLTRAELEAGVHCRGCGPPVIDGLGDLPPLQTMTDAEREAYEAAEADFRRRHADCHAIRWSVSGSRTAHCGFCCPPPPLSEQQLEAIAKLLVGVGRGDLLRELVGERREPEGVEAARRLIGPELAAGRQRQLTDLGVKFACCTRR